MGSEWRERSFLESRRRGRKKQSYARIRVASDAAMEHLLFDSGEDDKASSLFYPVKLDLERERGITGTWKRAVMPGRRR